MIYEALCDKCGETFNPHGTTTEDLEHWAREDGTECGGQGELKGSYVQDWRCQTCGGGDIHAFACPQNTGGYRT